MRGLTFSLLHRREPVRFIHKSSFPFSRNKRQINTIFSFSFSAEVFFFAITCIKSRSLLCFFFFFSCFFSFFLFLSLSLFQKVLYVLRMSFLFFLFFFRKPHGVIRQVFKGLFFFFFSTGIGCTSQRVCEMDALEFHPSVPRCPNIVLASATGFVAKGLMEESAGESPFYPHRLSHVIPTA